MLLSSNSASKGIDIPVPTPGLKRGPARRDRFIVIAIEFVHFMAINHSEPGLRCLIMSLISTPDLRRILWAEQFIFLEEILFDFGQQTGF